MNKLLSFVLLFVFSSTMFAQHNVTHFLGIPVDGSKSEMISKLKAKGFRYDSSADELTGEFNGTDVNIYVCTNNNKVWRIALVDVVWTTDENSIKSRFNRLIQQFSKNYSSRTDNSEIPHTEDISYEMLVHKKRYEAIFFQTLKDTALFSEEVGKALASKFTQEQLESPDIEMVGKRIAAVTEYALEDLRHRPVWFMIDEKYGKYRILMYYDNEYNRANGEDL